MGFFGAYVFDGSTWHGFDPDSDQRLNIAAPWLSVYIHDSDFATVRYEPRGPGSGTAYLGYTPRTYFGDESAPETTDVLRDAEGLALRLTRQQHRNDAAELRELIAFFLAGNFPEQHSGEHADDGEGAGDLEAGNFHHTVLALGGGQLFGLHTHPRAAGDRFDEYRTGLDHVAFACRDRDELRTWVARLDELGIVHGGIKDAHYGSGVSFRDPDGIALEFFAPPA